MISRQVLESEEVVSKISWTDKVWNPVTGCDAVSLGCDNCYAKKQANWLHGMGQANYKNNFKVTCHPHMLDKPSTWKKPCRVFVNSMSDLFHHDVPIEFVRDIFDRMYECERHIFQILTKRPKRMKHILSHIGSIYNSNNYLPNVWGGVSLENQDQEHRIIDLLNTPLAKRFVSCEPLLGKIVIRSEWVKGWDDCEQGIDWIIVGCENAPKKVIRPCNLDWIYKIVEDCNAFKIPVFVKQYVENGKIVKNIEDMRHDLQIQEFPV